MTTTESKTDPGLRPITRADEARVRAVVARALGPRCDADCLAWWTDGHLLSIMGLSWPAKCDADLVERLARGGIVPGPEGWCWAAESAHAETPAWLRDAVLAALPVDGTPVPFPDVLARVNTRGDISAPDLIDDLSAMAERGEIERCPEQDATVRWRRWGVPEGWGWREFSDVGVELLCRDGEPDTRGVIRAESNGVWLAYPRNGGRAFDDDVANPPTLPAAKHAALRACWEHGVFGAAPAEPNPIAEVTPAPHTRAEQVRHAILAVLTRSPVEGLARVLAAIDAAGVLPAADSAEVKQAAREIGAVIDGARWSLPDVPPGWGWTKGGAAVHSALKRGSQHVANVLRDGFWCIYTANGESAMTVGRAADPIAAQAASLHAARRAGLFDVEAPAEERRPSPTSTALSVGCTALDDARQARDVERLALLADRWLHERDAARADATKRQAWERDELAPRVDRLAELVSAPDGATIDHVLDLAIAALARALDTGPVRGEPAMPERVPVAAEARRTPYGDPLRAAVQSIIDGAAGDELEAHLRAWGASLIAEARRGLTVPHEVVHQQLAERAYAENAPYLFDVYQAAMRWREARLATPRDFDTIGPTVKALDALLDREPAPREPEPHPHRDVSERIARERDEARLEVEAATARAEKAEADLAALRQGIDDLRAAWVKGRAT